MPHPKALAAPTSPLEVLARQEAQQHQRRLDEVEATRQRHAGDVAQTRDILTALESFEARHGAFLDAVGLQRFEALPQSPRV